MTCNILVLFANDSEKLAMELINKFDHVPINYICVNNHSFQFSNLQQKPQAKIHVVFFSPDFLKFLENRESEAYHLCRHMESKSSLAVFCLGLKEENILCYHMAPLRSFHSWNKYEILSTSNEKHVFPNELMNRIREVLRHDSFAAEDIVVVPQFMKRHNNTVFVIFPRPIEGYNDLCIHLTDNENIEISLKKFNPYVMHFIVPNSLFQFSHNVIIRIQSGNYVLTNQVVHLSQDTPRNAHLNGTENPENAHPKLLTRQAMILDEELKYLKCISGLNPTDDTSNLHYKNQALKPEESQVIISENAKFDLKKLCKQYGLERLSFLMSDTSSNFKDEEEEIVTQEANFRKQIYEENKMLRYSRLMNDLPEMDSSSRMNSFLVEEAAGRHRVYSRSLSLPSTLLPTSDIRNSYGVYLDMAGKEPQGLMEPKPHERLLMGLRACKYLERGESVDGENLHQEVMNSLSSEHYMTLRMSESEESNTRALLKRGLSTSQQELLDIMHNFKEGECSMSSVENQFQLWKKRYGPKDDEAAKPTRKPSGLAMLWKKPKKKDLQVVIDNKEIVKPNTDAKEEEKVSTRKISSTSASSGSSKTSEKGTLTPSSRGESANGEQKFDDGTAPTGWVSSYSPTANRVFIPRYPKIEPPPLPSRPPPWSKMGIGNSRPTPLPRTIFPNSTNDTTEVIEEEKSHYLVEDSDNSYEEDDERSGSVYEFCQKYGLEKLGVCFASRERQLQDDREALKEDEMTKTNDHKNIAVRSPYSDGYEIHTRKKHEANTSTHGSLRRSISLPSNLSETYDLPEDFLKSTENAIQHQTENNVNACICDQCKKDCDCFTNNFYMSLLEFRRDTCADDTPPLSKSQQELLDLMYDFKRGEKTISQVEGLFQEWHSRNMESECPHNFTQPCNKLPKQSSFGLPAFMKFLGKQKKKTTAESKFEYDLEKSRTKNSDAATTAQKHLSKLSYTSTSSGNSESSEVSKSTKDGVKRPEVNADTIAPVCPKRPPPVPTKRPFPSQELAKSSEASQTQTLPASTTNTTFQQNPPKREKPIPPPKPKFVLNTKTGSLKSVGFQSKAEQPNTEKQKEDGAEDSDVRPSSPDYIVPDIHKRPRRPKLQRQPRRIDSDQKGPTALSRRPLSPTTLANLPAVRSRKITESSEPEISVQTLELLKKANLCDPDMPNPMFYVGRSNSDPSLRKRKPPPVKKRHIYLEILPPLESDTQTQSKTVNHDTAVS